MTRRVPSDCYVALETNRYPVPFEWVRRDVEVQVLAREIVIRSESAEPVRHERIVGSHQLARWHGVPRRLPKGSSALAPGPPKLDPIYPATVGEVHVRPLSCYEEVAQ